MRAEANEKRPNLKIEERCSRRKTTRKKENDDLKGLVILLETGILLKVMKRIAFQEKKDRKSHISSYTYAIFVLSKELLKRFQI